MSPNRRITIQRGGETDVEVFAAAEVIDEPLIKESVEWIRNTLAKTLYRAGTEVGEYVLDKYFAGDPERVRSRNPYKNASFRRLAEICGTPELPISRSWLHNAVSVAVMERLLPQGATAFRALPPSHKVTLVSLQNPEQVEKLAQRAIKKRLTVRELKNLVNDETPKMEKDPRGRKPMPVVIKTLTRSLKLFTLGGGRRSFKKADIDILTDMQAREALKAATDLINTLAVLVEKLEDRAR